MQLIVGRINFLQFVKKLLFPSVEYEYKHIDANELDDDAIIQNASEYPGRLGRIIAAGQENEVLKKIVENEGSTDGSGCDGGK